MNGGLLGILPRDILPLILPPPPPVSTRWSRKEEENLRSKGIISSFYKVVNSSWTAGGLLSQEMIFGYQSKKKTSCLLFSHYRDILWSSTIVCVQYMRVSVSGFPAVGWMSTVFDWLCVRLSQMLFSCVLSKLYGCLIFGYIVSLWELSFCLEIFLQLTANIICMVPIQMAGCSF
jgi:hypothetical protein